MTTAVRERPILFSGEMVRKLLSGAKTQTRRVVKLSDPSQTYATFDDDNWPLTADECGEWHRDSCPYGTVGDRLWVRETWCPLNACYEGAPRRMKLPAGGKGVIPSYRADHLNPEGDGYPLEWRPSIFMPRWASRLTLEITEVRVERLQAISEEDARDEGCPGTNVCWSSPYINGAHTNDGELPSEEFKRLWDSINGKSYPWKSNPRVWAISFKRLD